MGGNESSAPRFAPRDRVKVKSENPGGTKRTPPYVRGKLGTIVTVHGIVGDHAHDHSDLRGPLYSVAFDCAQLFQGGGRGQVVLDLHESWLEIA